VTEVLGHTSVMAARRPPLAGGGMPHQKHELFPTPPWATRALFAHVLPAVGYADFTSSHVLWDPCAGLGHMSEVLTEYSRHTMATDLVFYAIDGNGGTEHLGIDKFDFLSEGNTCRADWIITNPPFRSAHLFLEPALRRARRGVAFFERIQWLETVRRYPIFIEYPPFLAAFSERVMLCEGGYDMDGSTASMYAWYVWPKNCKGALEGPLRPGGTGRYFLIPPVCKKTLSKPFDLVLAKRCVPGWIAPSAKRKARK